MDTPEKIFEQMHQNLSLDAFHMSEDDLKIIRQAIEDSYYVGRICWAEDASLEEYYN